MHRGHLTILILTLMLAGLDPGTASCAEPEKPADHVTCGENGLDAVVSLRYDQLTTKVAGFFMNLRYPKSVSLPGKGADEKVAKRVKGVAVPNLETLPVVQDIDGDGRSDQLRILMTSSKGQLPSDEVVRIHFDCERGASIAPSDFACSLEQVVDREGLLPKDTANQVGCSVSLKSEVATKS